MKTSIPVGTVCVNTRKDPVMGKVASTSLVVLVDTATPRRWWRPTINGMAGDFAVAPKARKAAPQGGRWTGLLAVELPARWDSRLPPLAETAQYATWLAASLQERVAPEQSEVRDEDIAKKYHEVRCVWTLVDPDELVPYVWPEEQRAYIEQALKDLGPLGSAGFSATFSTTPGNRLTTAPAIETVTMPVSVLYALLNRESR